MSSVFNDFDFNESETVITNGKKTNDDNNNVVCNAHLLKYKIVV